MAKIAVIGTGISGLASAYLLGASHDVTVYEKETRLGGHTRTLNVRYGGRNIPVDTGFIVFNQPNYPHLSAMFRHLGVPTHRSDMTFAASIRDGWFEWGAENLNTVFGQRRNMLRPAFYGVCRDVMRFNAQAVETVERHPGLTLGGLIAKLKLGEWFRRYYLLPMGGAIWSCPLSQMLEFPARTFVRFFQNHGLLAFSGQPQWYTVTGGAQNYVDRLTQGFSGQIRSGCGAAQVTRFEGGACVTDDSGQSKTFDHVVFACHGDQALAALGDASDAERNILGAFRYQRNEAVLHRHESVMPRRRRCWSSWNYRSDGRGDGAAVSVSYWMNKLQGIDPAYPIFVTLNPAEPIPDEYVFDRHTFDHPVFDQAATAAQGQVQQMQGARNTWFCGAHLRHGFHEDGLWSAVTVAERLGAAIPWTVPDATPAREPAIARTGARHRPAYDSVSFLRGPISMAQIVTARVFHARTRPKRNAFRYGVYYLRLKLEELAVPPDCALFSLDRFNLFSIRASDYQTGKLPVQETAAAALAEFGVTEADGPVELITLPRVLGFAFNPVSFWLCHDAAKNLRAVIATVNNTFGEQHRYLCCHADHRPIAADDWLEAKKIFHVSPFLAVDGTYRFRFDCPPGKIAIWINHHDTEGLLLSTSLIGDTHPLTSARLLACFFRYPLVTFKVVALIHYQAVKLFLKGMRHYRKPAPPLSGISR